jgi:hypothetical protein
VRPHNPCVLADRGQSAARHRAISRSCRSPRAPRATHSASVAAARRVATPARAFRTDGRAFPRALHPARATAADDARRAEQHPILRLRSLQLDLKLRADCLSQQRPPARRAIGPAARERRKSALTSALPAAPARQPAPARRANPRATRAGKCRWSSAPSGDRAASRRSRSAPRPTNDRRVGVTKRMRGEVNPTIRRVSNTTSCTA